ncbi:MAG: PhoP regulatory network YrbL family protein [Burkholderiaceae bacterium]|jgi:hypothetical protein|nr:PhoP regulatory network YrbL family protein [Burkholderiaceae bacterium]
MNTAEEIVFLKEELFIGEGEHKKCYEHPGNGDLCVKVIHSAFGKRKDAIDKAIKREVGYQTAMNKNGACLLAPISRYFGTVKTNFGTGYVFELIRDGDGRISSSLHEYLKSDDVLRNFLPQLVHVLLKLREDMLSLKIVTMNIFPKNILVQKGPENIVKLVIVDNVGSASLIPLEYYIPYFALARVNRRWARFMRFLEGRYKNLLAVELLKQLAVAQPK